jgi:hypothetical protein
LGSREWEPCRLVREREHGRQRPRSRG